MTDDGQTDIHMQIGSDIVRSYKRLAYTPWHALAEFVDNSTQSYFNNRTELDKLYAAEKTRLTVRIVYDRDEGYLRVSDNAMGMDLEELTNALVIGRAPAVTDGRSQFGLGLKTAACWMGDTWSVTTKKAGEEMEHSVTVSVEAVANGDLDLHHSTVAKPVDKHYTIVEARDLHRKIQGRRLGKIKEFLASMYRVDIRDGLLDLYWIDSPLIWEDNLEFLRASDGTEYRKTFSFDVDGKKVEGWAGVLGKGSSGRPRAGFSILRRGRVVKGHPLAWRPQSVFGQLEGSNDLINQRVTGEISLDDFEVSHTKDDILWEGDEEDQVQDRLKQELDDYIRIAKITFKSMDDDRGPSEMEVQAAVDELREEMESQEFVDIIDIQDVPPPEAVEEANRVILEAAGKEEPGFTASVGTTQCKIYLAGDGSPYDPYYVAELGEDAILVVVNRRHPHWGQLRGSEGVLNYLRHCVYDAIAEWECARKGAAVRPETIKMLKDQLLRLPSEIEQGADAASYEAAAE